MTKKIINCATPLQAVVDSLEAEGADAISIVTALTNIAVRAAKNDRRLTPVHLDAMAAIISTAADMVRARRVAMHIDDLIEAKANSEVKA